MTEPTADHPLVTFALFAYNQENYIREALEGAFAQTYEPLEIILSDDCSSDRTFEIIQEMAATYAGPHLVSINQTKQNQGVAAHINEVSKLCRGDIVVVAAGDDISMPDRSRRISEVFHCDATVFAVFSDFFVLGEPQVAKSYCRTIQEISHSEIFYGGGGVGAGATYAYRRKLFNWPSPLPRNCLSEDRLLPARAAILGSVCKLCEPLVGYRIHEESLHSKLKVEKKLAREIRRASHSGSIAN